MEHICDNDLKRYYLGMLPNEGPEVVTIVEHLRWCQVCVARAEQSDRYVDEMRAAIIGGNFDLK